jgi:hypothetical protein
VGAVVLNPERDAVVTQGLILNDGPCLLESIAP